MNNTQQQKITRWLFVLGLLIVGLIVVSLAIPSQGNPNPEALVTGDPTSTLTPTYTLFPTQEMAQAASLTSTPFPTVTNPPASNLSPTPEKNCTYPATYWKDHPEAWLAENILIGELTYTKEDAISILETDTEDVPTNVLKQLFATILNILKGADASRIENSVVTTIDWLGQHSPDSQLSETDQLTGMGLIDVLEKYNGGQTDPQLCPDAPRTPTPTPTFTNTPTRTRSPFTVAPPTSATPTKKPGEGQPGKPATNTPQPQATEPPPTQPPPTQPPPTQPPPPPTPTSAPPPTEAPTEPPATSLP
ncbi:MAG TPA: hypothetical protein VE136_00160 [Anaerolineales bacterium]|nr:hypothetical protein [Anaerolineales bacterium]